MPAQDNDVRAEPFTDGVRFASVALILCATALLPGACAQAAISQERAADAQQHVALELPLRSWTLPGTAERMYYADPLTMGGELIAARRDERSGRMLLAANGGCFTAAVIEREQAFDDLIVSWNVDVPAGAGFCVEVQVAQKADSAGQSDWSPWLYLGDWGRAAPEQERLLTFSGGKVRVDYLRTNRPMQSVRWRLRALGGEPGQELGIAGLAMCFSDSRSFVLAPAALARPAATLAGTLASRDLQVPSRSQRLEDPALASRICSPTSVAMVLDYHGHGHATAEVARRLYDPTHDLYGNWPRAVQGAWTLGVPGVLARFCDWRAVEEVLAHGLPLILSIGVKAGQLRGAPYEKTSGHLIVLRGFDEQGRALCNDPAADSLSGVARRYAREDLELVWMKRGGLAYVIGSGSE